ncbi:phytanoyl-CoA dioxygenase [Sphingobacterium corticibacterium]|uniref:Phytanoyl-CoA dioxygenase n=2 Tax=Sphingobacterium corticibacterium TaxID=2484746 RepID=A0A4Q6XPS2_9SPHI|nr:phytanoyl-CoA dioxygenase [Sphingobacterium corticibacterium]
MKIMTSNIYATQGYVIFKNFFKENELLKLEYILEKFHNVWLSNNQKDYKNGLINSHSITSSSYINEEERLFIFKFISKRNIEKIVGEIFPDEALFLNTQLFFEPFNRNQHNYWHRDIQYTGRSINEQKQKIKTENIVHFRIPLRRELGIELIPSTHKEWDTDEEFETRLSLNGRKPSDNLQRGKIIQMDRGDLLVFSANMIHRGLYGNNRLTFDIIFCDNTQDFKSFLNINDCPNTEEMESLKESKIFKKYII